MKKRTYLLWKKLLTRLLVTIYVVGALYVYFRTGVFTIHTYKIIGAPEEQVENLQQQLTFTAERPILKVFPGNRVVSYHDDEMRTAIMETLPNTRTISIHPSGLHTLSVQLTQHKPLFAVSETHAISEEGVIYKEIQPLQDFPHLEIASSTEVSPKTLFAISELIKNTNAVLFEVRYIAIDEYGDIRLYDSSKRTSIIVASNFDVKKIWSNILSAIDTDPLKKKLTDTSERLEYIDTRFGNKVFYKFTNGASTGIIPPHQNEVATTTIQ